VRRLSGVLVVVAMLVLVAACGPGLAAAASIQGTVSAADTHEGIGGVEVCPTPQPYTFEVDCVQTDSNGHYSVAGLAPTQYMLSFSAWRNNLPFVSEFYADKPNNLGADLVTLTSPDESRGLDIELARGGSIAGILTDEATGQPITGMGACARDNADLYERCTKSDAGGFYQVNGLPSGEYSVYYENWNQVNYLREFYEDVETWAQATGVGVVAPGTTPGIDARLAQGAQILGHVSQAGTGLPLPEAFVCAELLPPDEYMECDLTDAVGNYALMGLPAGSYLVAFEMESLPWGHFARQWWQGVAGAAEATPIAIAPPETRTGIDGQVDRIIWGPPSAAETPAATSAATAPTRRAPKPLPRKCRKGFHRKLVKGKKRCVRKQRRHRHRHHQHDL
jgi:hypothetical protein